ncbi:MAG: alpha/beta hydrolase [Roseiflexaceae bacterium]|nr:alpha/beta hydrolase [Roseiflexaceae bacterium]
MTTHVAQTPLLDLAYETHGPSDGPPVVLLHGFPDDACAWEAVAAPLAAAGYRTIAPYLRGFGPTRFRDAATIRSGQNAALAQDVLDLADLLGLGRFTLIGHDWGAQAAQAVAALQPARVQHLVSFSPYSLTWDDYQEGPPNYPQLQALWYQQVLQSELGEQLLAYDRQGFCRYLWATWSPSWQLAAATFADAAVSFDNPDFVAVVLHAYRSGYGQAELDPRYNASEAQLAQRPPISVPTTVLLGEDDGINLFQPAMLAQQRDFTGAYTARAYPGVGHFIHREQPAAVVAAIMRTDAPGG